MVEEATDDNCRRKMDKIQADFYWEIAKNLGGGFTFEINYFVGERFNDSDEYDVEFIAVALNREVG